MKNDVKAVDLDLRSYFKESFSIVRQFTENICSPLEIEDYVIQSMTDVSPTKWHLAHTTWFFETFILKKYDKAYKPLNDLYNYLFNSYYVQVGERFYRPHRGLLSRPTVREVFEFRKYVDERMEELIYKSDEEQLNEMLVVFNIGLNHEQQHQELMLTDVKHVLSINPIKPVYKKKSAGGSESPGAMEWIQFDGGVKEIGYNGNGYYFDNEQPLHKQYLQPFEMGNRLVTNGEYLEFILDKGYQNTILWLSDGIAAVEDQHWKSPLYWENQNGEWFYFTLNGYRKLDLNEPLAHVSFYEAEAYARWKGKRLPTEAEWEVASNDETIEGNFAENENFNPVPLSKKAENKLHQIFGDVWEWTRSDYSPYPGYKAPEGAIGEYNGKFMSGQIVLRGGSCVTSKSHIRRTYRNFFPHKSRWQFSGIRLTGDLK